VTPGSGAVDTATDAPGPSSAICPGAAAPTVGLAALTSSGNTCYTDFVSDVPAAEASAPPAYRWVLLALQLPARPSNARVSAWRRLQQLGAVAVKHAVYVLPHSTQALEDFAWIRREVEARGGQAAVFSASAVEDLGNTDIVEQFRTGRAADYNAFLTELRRVFPRRTNRKRPDIKTLRPWRERLEQIRQIDFFSAPGGSDAEAALEVLERAARQGTKPATSPRTLKPLERRDYQGRTWVTRPRPGVDRFASAWLIRRFIDPKAVFTFTAKRVTAPDAIPFDMYDHEGFGHDGDRCTFEVLQWRFAISDPAVSRLAEIVHDVDLKDDRFHAHHASSIELLVAGLRASHANDHALLEHGMTLFEALYSALSASPTTSRLARSRT